MSGFPTIGPGDDVEPLILDPNWLNGCTRAIAVTSGIDAPSDLPDGFGRQPFVCKIKNNSGADVGRYGILGIDGPLFDKVANEKYFLGGELQFKGVKPKAEHAGRTAHCLGPIKQGKIGLAIVPNAVQCQVDIVTATDRFASIIDDDLVKLKSGRMGTYPMVPAETGTGTKWAIVFLVSVSGPRIIHGQAVGVVTGGGFTIDNITVRRGPDPRTNPASSSETIAVLNPFGWNIDDNGLVRAEGADDGTWDAVQAKCPA